MALRDAFDRQFSYLRLSVVDSCNFRCVYCLPNGYRKPASEPPPLSLDEIRRLVAAFAELGFWKVRITGGEPTMRADLLDIVRCVAAQAGVTKVALSTNGFRLTSLAPRLKEAGLTQLNVSVDSLDPDTFHRLTGHRRLADILEGIETAHALGFRPVKVNAVLMKETELEPFFDWAMRAPVSVRFIELMRTGGNGAIFERHHVPSTELMERLVRAGWKRQEREEGAGPAVEFCHADAEGRIGIIAPYAKDFCATCNRLRVNSRGDLRLCLFGEGGYSLRRWLGSDSESDRLALKETVASLLKGKLAGHALAEGNYGATGNFASIGG